MGTQVSKQRSVRVIQPQHDLNTFAVITIVFNPVRFKSRYELYRKFQKHMVRSGINLFTVECIFEADEKLGLPKQKFEITSSNDRRHLQIRAPSVMWLKENLINIAVEHLPSYIEYVAWIDADVEFQRLDWPHLTIEKLQLCPIVQLFQLSLFLGPAGRKQILRRDYSFAFSIRNNKPIDAFRSSTCQFHPGYAWAMRRETFKSIGGLLDFSIVGAGDIHFAYALLNRIDETIPLGINDEYRRLAHVWGQRVAKVAQNGANIGYIPAIICHFWHGNRRDRKYNDRWSILERFRFCPLTDLEKNNKTGLLRLKNSVGTRYTTSFTRLQLLEANIIEYFRSRDEDNVKTPLETSSFNVLSNAPAASPNDFFLPITESSMQNENSFIEDKYRSDSSSFENYPPDRPSYYISNNNEVVL